MDAPRAFRARFSEHNRHAILIAFLAAILAGIGWALLYFSLCWIGVLLETLVHGTEAENPEWIRPVFFIVAAVLLFIAALEYVFGRFATMSDRSIIGWHLVRDFALFLPRLTFAVFGNLLACRILSGDDLRRAWALLQRIRQQGRGDFFTLSQVEPDARRLNALLLALQFGGFIDLHQGEETWFYLVKGEEIPLVDEMMKLEE